jgi:hypothetical protein
MKVAIVKTIAQSISNVCIGLEYQSRGIDADDHKRLTLIKQSKEKFCDGEPAVGGAPASRRLFFGAAAHNAAAFR